MSTLHYRLVVVEPSAVTPFVPAQAALPLEHFYVTSRRRADHPWIEAIPEGEGQSLDPVTGKVSDGQYTLRVIDVPETCVLGQVLYQETLDADYLTTGGWTIDGDYPGDPTWAPWVTPASPTATGNGWWTADPSHPILSGHALFNWLDGPCGAPCIGLGPWTRSTWIKKTLTGFTPGQRVGIHIRANWTLDTGAGNIFFQINGERVSIPNGSYDFWTLDPALSSNIQDNYLAGYADASGNVEVWIGGENYSPSCNVQCVFEEIEVVGCLPDTSTNQTGPRYVTRWLADTRARQQMLGRRAYLEQSFDAGATWQSLFAGYVTGLTMQESIVFEFTIGDTRRVERTRRAWRDLDPAGNSDFQHMSAILSGPIYKGFKPYQPVHQMQRFQIVAQQAATGALDDQGLPDGWVRLRWIQPNYGSAARNMVGRLLAVSDLNRDVEEFFEPFAPNSGISGMDGAFPGLRATLITVVLGAIAYSDAIPLSQGRLAGGRSTAARGMVSRLMLANTHQLIRNQEIVLSWGIEDTVTYPNGMQFFLLVTPRTVSTKYPLFWRGHPVDLVTQLYDAHGIDYDATSATTLKTTLGEDLVTVLRFTSPEETVQDVVTKIQSFYGFATRVDGVGVRHFFAYRRFITTPAESLTSVDVHKEGGPTFELDESSRRNRIILRQQYFQEAEDDDINDAPSGIAAIDASATFNYSGDGGTTLDADVYGPLEETFEIPGHTALAKDGPVAGDLEASVPVNLVQYGTGIARFYFAQFGRGLQFLTVAARRGTDADNVLLGTDVTVDLDHVPNAQLGQDPTSQRGGTRSWMAVQRVEQAPGPKLRLADANTGVAYGNVVTLTLQPDDVDPVRFRKLIITNSTDLYADAAWLAIEVSIDDVPASNEHGVLYTAFDGLMMVDSASVLQDPWTTRIGPFPDNALVYVRAAGFLVGGALGTWSDWTGVGGAIGTPGSGLSGLIIGQPTATTIPLAWSNGDVTNQVRISYRVNDTGAWTVASTEAIGATSYTITGLTKDQMYGVRVVLWNGVAEVGLPLTGRAVTMDGALTGPITVTSGPTATGATIAWTNSSSYYQVRVERRINSGPADLWEVDQTLHPGSVVAVLTNLYPATLYDLRISLVDPITGIALFNSAITGSLTTAAAGSGPLNPTTYATGFSGWNPVTNQADLGVYGLQVWTANTVPHQITFSVAVETGVGTGVFGAATDVAVVEANLNGYTQWSAIAPNDGLLRQVTARATAYDYTDSSSTTAITLNPWTTQLPVTYQGDTLPTGTEGQFLIHDGTEWVAAEVLTDAGDVLVDETTGDVVYDIP